MVAIRTENEIQKVKKSCQYVVLVLKALREMIAPGITTFDLEKKARELLREFNVKSAFLNYGNPPFPATLCASVNEEVVHGIPSKKRVLKEGDIVSLDFGVECDGYFGDAACSVLVGEVKPEIHELAEITKEALARGVSKAVAGNRIGDISSAIQTYVESNGCGVIREFVGHGIGNKLHEEPQISNFGEKNTGILLKSGMILAIEPMVSLGKPDVRILNDGWTAVTKDGSCSAHFENTIVVTDGEPRILTDFGDDEIM